MKTITSFTYLNMFKEWEAFAKIRITQRADLYSITFIDRPATFCTYNQRDRMIGNKNGNIQNRF